MARCIGHVWQNKRLTFRNKHPTLYYIWFILCYDKHFKQHSLNSNYHFIYSTTKKMIYHTQSMYIYNEFTLYYMLIQTCCLTLFLVYTQVYLYSNYINFIKSRIRYMCAIIYYITSLKSDFFFWFVPLNRKMKIDLIIDVDINVCTSKTILTI